MTVRNEVSVLPLSPDQQGSPFYVALAQTTTRAIALYFSRPVRLFRPSKVSGWHSLRGHANRHGASLSPQYVVSLVKSQGVVAPLHSNNSGSRLTSLKFMVIPKHFVPPMLANAVLGTVLWTTYTGCSSYLQSRLGIHSVFAVAFSGAAAGGMQALVAAPVENVRLVIEGGAGKGWSHAWKEVFRGTQPIITSRSRQLRDIRQLRLWMKDVTEMAGRGWAGWGWGCGKDVCGFAAFFSIFEITRKAAREVKLVTQHTLRGLQSGNEASHNSHLPRFIHAFTLVCGGVMAGLAYEKFCQPWDAARRAVSLQKLHPTRRQPVFSILMRKLEADGIASFFREHSAGFSDRHELRSNAHRRISSAFRTLARVGPWGVGFLVWESFGPGLD